jgi:hypothetical protein
MTKASCPLAAVAVLALAGCAATPSPPPTSTANAPVARTIAPPPAAAAPAAVAAPPLAPASPDTAATPAVAVAPAGSTASGPARAPRDLLRAPDGLGDLDAMTFACSKAGLNAAAREAAKAPSQGRYQFSYFRIVDSSHQAMYEVHFKSNYRGEPDLRYCVALYCQQGIDPKTAKTSVSLMGEKSTPRAPRAAATGHAADCGDAPMLPAKGHAKR